MAKKLFSVRLPRNLPRHTLRLFRTAAPCLFWVLASNTLLRDQAEAGAIKPQIPQSPTLDLSVFCQAAGRNSEEATIALEDLARGPSGAAYDALGTLFHQNRNTRCSIESFEEALRVDPSLWQTRYKLALELIDLQRYKDAAEKLRTVIEQNPKWFAAHNALGLVLSDLGDLDGAANEFKIALKLNPNFIYATSNLARVLHAERKYAAEIYYLRQALDSDPPRDLAFELQLALGSAYDALGNTTEDTNHAAEALRALVRSYPQSAEAHYNLGTFYARHLRYEEAKPELDETLRLDPGYNAAHLLLGQDLYELGDSKDAVLQLQKYVSLVAQDYEGHFALGLAYEKQQDFLSAAHELREAVAIKPDDYAVRYNLGEALARSGQTDEAVMQLELAQKLNPDAPEAPYRLGLIFSHRNEKDKAEQEIEAFEHAKELNQENANKGELDAKGRTLFERGDAQGATEAFRDFLKLSPTDGKTHYNLSLALGALGDTTEQKRELEKAVELDPTIAEANNQLGILYMQEGRFQDAEREFKEALEIDPGYAEAENNLGSLLGRLGKSSDALVLFQKATHDAPKYGSAYLNEGLILASEGHYGEAEALIRQAIACSPNNADVYTALGMLMQKQGHPEEAVGSFKKVVDLQPNSAGAHINMGIALADDYDMLGALGQFSDAVRLDPKSPSARYNLGRTLYDIGKRDQARAQAKVAFDLAPEDPSILYLRALTERQAENRASSREALEKLVRLDPRDSQAQSLLGEVLLDVGRQEEALQHWKLAAAADPNSLTILQNLSRQLERAHRPEAKVYEDRLKELEQKRGVTDRVSQLNDSALDSASARNWRQAAAQLKLAVGICGQCRQLSILHKNLGLIYARTGEVANGEQELRLALKLNPKDDEALKALDTLSKLQNGNGFAD